MKRILAAVAASVVAVGLTATSASAQANPVKNPSHVKKCEREGGTLVEFPFGSGDYYCTIITPYGG